MIFRDSSASKAGADETIRGIWFHDGKERDQIASYLEQVVKSLVRIDEMERNHPPTQAFVVSDGEKEETARQDAGAALLSTLTLGSNNNHESTTASGAVPPARQEEGPGQPAATRSPLSTHQNLVLDKKSLQLSLLSLIQDERFLDLIHAQYLKVVHTRATRQTQSQQKENGTDK